MRVGFFVPVVLLSLSGFALAQSLPPATVARVVPTGKTRQVGFFATINPDCTGAGDADARVIKQADNGTVELEPGSGFGVFPEKDARAACNTKQLQGLRIKYTSKDGYVGLDSFDIEFLTPNGADIVWKYSITVK